MLNLIETMSDKTKMIGAGAIALTVAAAISYHLDKKRTEKDEEDVFPEEDVFDPIIDEDEA